MVLGGRNAPTSSQFFLVVNSGAWRNWVEEVGGKAGPYTATMAGMTAGSDATLAQHVTVNKSGPDDPRAGPNLVLGSTDCNLTTLARRR